MPISSGITTLSGIGTSSPIPPSPMLRFWERERMTRTPSYSSIPRLPGASPAPAPPRLPGPYDPLTTGTGPYQGPAPAPPRLPSPYDPLTTGTGPYQGPAPAPVPPRYPPVPPRYPPVPIRIRPELPPEAIAGKRLTAKEWTKLFVPGSGMTNPEMNQWLLNILSNVQTLQGM